jgi:hypothetical protein
MVSGETRRARVAVPGEGDKGDSGGVASIPRRFCVCVGDRPFVSSLHWGLRYRRQMPKLMSNAATSLLPA